MSKGEPIGIDFGTTKTLACKWDKRSERPVPIRLGRSKDEIPTSIHHDKIGNLSFGDDADDLRITDSAGYIPCIKRRLGKDAKFILRNGQTVTSVELIGKFLCYLRERIETEAIHDIIGHAVITVPALYGPAARNELENAIKQAGYTDFSLLDEPKAGGIAFLRDNPDKIQGQTFLVFDWGGGTLDLAVIHRDGDTLEPDPDLIGGHPNLGGEDIDENMYDAVGEQIMKDGAISLDDHPEEYKVKVREALIDGKILLSRKPAHTFRLLLENKNFVFEWKRESFEQFIGNDVNRAISQLEKLVNKAKDNQTDLDCALLIGGTSIIPLVSRNIENVIGLKTLAWDYGKEAVGLGAAIYAHHLHYQNVDKGEPQEPLDEDTARPSKNTISTSANISSPLSVKFTSPEYGYFIHIKQTVYLNGKIQIQNSRVRFGSDILITNTSFAPLNNLSICLFNKTERSPMKPLVSKALDPYERIRLTTYETKWILKPNNEIEVKYHGLPNPIRAIIKDKNCQIHDLPPLPIIATWDSGVFSGKVLKLVNVRDQPLINVSVHTSTGSAMIEVLLPNNPIKLGWFEFSDGRNLEIGDVIEIKNPGFAPSIGLIE